MSNFEYIIASLPYLTADYRYEDGQGWKDVIDQIRENLSQKDSQVLDVLLDGFDAKNLNADFYAAALSHPCKFIREYFRFDLNLRNAKVHFLNDALGRPANQDIMDGKGGQWDQDLDIDGYRFNAGEFPQAALVESALGSSSLLDREKGLDDITWDFVDSLGSFHYFDITAVLTYVAKLHIVDRWLALDQEKGRELFRQLVSQVRGTFKGVEFN